MVVYQVYQLPIHPYRVSFKIVLFYIVVLPLLLGWRRGLHSIVFTIFFFKIWSGTHGTTAMQTKTGGILFVHAIAFWMIHSNLQLAIDESGDSVLVLLMSGFPNPDDGYVFVVFQHYHPNTHLYVSTKTVWQIYERWASHSSWLFPSLYVFSHSTWHIFVTSHQHISWASIPLWQVSNDIFDATSTTATTTFFTGFCLSCFDPAVVDMCMCALAATLPSQPACLFHHWLAPCFHRCHWASTPCFHPSFWQAPSANFVSAGHSFLFFFKKLRKLFAKCW